MPAFTPRFAITNAITAGLTAIERARGFLEAATLSDEWVALSKSAWDRCAQGLQPTPLFSG